MCVFVCLHVCVYVQWWFWQRTLASPTCWVSTAFRFRRWVRPSPSRCTQRAFSLRSSLAWVCGHMMLLVIVSDHHIQCASSLKSLTWVRGHTIIPSRCTQCALSPRSLTWVHGHIVRGHTIIPSRCTQCALSPRSLTWVHGHIVRGHNIVPSRCTQHTSSHRSLSLGCVAVASFAASCSCMQSRWW